MVNTNTPNEEKPGEGPGPAEPMPMPMPMCPMAESCKRMMERPFPGFLMFIPGIVFIVFGILIIIEPAILAWLIAAALILVGAVMLGGVCFMRSVGARWMRAHR